MMTQKDVKISDEEIVYKGFFQLRRVELTYRLYAGDWGLPLVREVFDRHPAVGVLLYDPRTDQVVLTEQFRIGAYADQTSPWLIEIVAGVIDHPGETSQTAVAHRETQEETGLSIERLIPLCDYWVSPGASTERFHLFCAHVDATQAGGIHGLVEEGEDIRVLIWDRQRAIQALQTGEIRNAATIIALQWLALNHAVASCSQ